MTTILACGNCHTPKDARGPADRRQGARGGGIGFDIPPFAGVAANITPDRETGIGTWSDAEIKRAITHAERPAARPARRQAARAPMAANFFKAILPGDLDAIVAYLRSLPPVRKPSPRRSIACRCSARRSPLADRGFSDRDLRDPVRRGAYLATIGHCLECHTPLESGTLQLDTALGAGGRPFLPSFVKGLPESWTGRGVAQCHADPRARPRRLERRRDQARHHPGRRPRRPQAPAADAYAWYAGIRDDDLDALVAYLRTLPPLPR